VRRVPLPRGRWSPAQHRSRHDTGLLPRPGPVPSQIHRTHLRSDAGRLRPREYQNAGTGGSLQLFLATKGLIILAGTSPATLRPFTFYLLPFTPPPCPRHALPQHHPPPRCPWNRDSHRDSLAEPSFEPCRELG